jgi:hypothetical protein
VPTLVGMGQSLLVNPLAAREPEAYSVVSRFVTRDTSEEEFRFELAGLWQSHDGPFLRAVQHLLAQFDPVDSNTEELRGLLGALMSASPPPELGFVGRVVLHRSQLQRGSGSVGDATTTTYVSC